MVRDGWHLIRWPDGREAVERFERQVAPSGSASLLQVEGCTIEEVVVLKLEHYQGSKERVR